MRYSYWQQRLGALGEESNIYANVTIHHPAKVQIGNNVSVAEYVHLWGGGGIEIDDNVMIASHTVITSQSHDSQQVSMRHSAILKPVKIAQDVWIGSHAVIMPGVTIGRGSVVGAGSVVTRDVPENVIVVGMPATVLRTRI